MNESEKLIIITMSELQVSCITKSNTYGGHEHITHIGGYTQSAWLLSKEEAIARIDSKKEAFYTIDTQTGRKAYVGVVRGDGYKAPYLRTHADGKWNDNLLAQNACSIRHTLIA
jgi:hypothetical protein